MDLQYVDTLLCLRQVNIDLELCHSSMLLTSREWTSIVTI